VSLLRMSAIRLLRSVRVSVSISCASRLDLADVSPHRRRPTTSSGLRLWKKLHRLGPLRKNNFRFFIAIMTMVKRKT